MRGFSPAGAFRGYTDAQDFLQRQQHNKQLMALQQIETMRKQRLDQQEQEAAPGALAAISAFGQPQSEPTGGAPSQGQPTPLLPQSSAAPSAPTAPGMKGMKPELASALSQLFAAGKAQGHDLGISPHGGFRTGPQQASLYGQDVAAHGGKPSGMVAAPGKSQHEVGAAGDVTAGGQLVRGGPADQFLGANAGKYGLQRPVKGEPWHMELIAKAAPEAEKTAMGAGQQVPREQWGRATIGQMMEAIDKASPNASPLVKLMAMERAQKLLAPIERQEYLSWRQENQQNFRAGLAEFQAGVRQDIAAGQQQTQRDIAGMRDAGFDRRLGTLEAGRDRRQERGEEGRDKRQDKAIAARQAAAEAADEARQQRDAMRSSDLWKRADVNTKRQAINRQLSEIDVQYKALTTWGVPKQGDPDFASIQALDKERKELIAELQRVSGTGAAAPIQPRTDQ